MSVLPLDGCREKLSRAERHIDELRTAIAALRPQLEREPDLSTGGDLVRAINVEVPLGLSVVCGEAIHQMRSIFDHVVCALVVSYGHSVTEHHAFPFFRTDDDVERRTIHRTEGIPQESEPYRLIRALQATKELAILVTLDNLYKHRNLLLIATRVSTKSITLNVPLWGPPGSHLVATIGLPMNLEVAENSVASRVVYGNVGVSHPVDPIIEASFRIVFEGQPLVAGVEVVAVLNELFAFTSRALTAFEFLLPRSPMA